MKEIRQPQQDLKNLTVNFDIDEVLEIKGLYFKVVLIDAFTGALGLKRISKEEAGLLKEKFTGQRPKGRG